MSITFAANLTKMIDAGLGGEMIAPETSVAVGYHAEFHTVLGEVAKWIDPTGGLELKSCKVYPDTARSPVNVWRTGKNILDPDTVLYPRYFATNGVWKYSADSRSIAIPVKPNTTYTLSRYLTDGSIYRVACISVDNLPAVSDTSTSIPITNVVREMSAADFGTTRTYTTDGTATYMAIQFASATTVDFVAHGQIEFGPNATEYAAPDIQKKTLPNDSSVIDVPGITSVKGLNNVWSDSGEVEVTWKELVNTEGY